MKNFMAPLVRAARGALAEEAETLIRRCLLAAVALFLALAGLIGCLVTAYMYLSAVVPAREAMLLVTLGVLLLALVMGLVARYPRPGKRGTTPLDEPQPSPGADDPAATFAALGAEAGKQISRHPKNAAVMAAVAGIALGMSPELRRALLNQIFPTK